MWRASGDVDGWPIAISEQFCSVGAALKGCESYSRLRRVWSARRCAGSVRRPAESSPTYHAWCNPGTCRTSDSYYPQKAGKGSGGIWFEAGANRVRKRSSTPASCKLSHAGLVAAHWETGLVQRKKERVMSGILCRPLSNVSGGGQQTSQPSALAGEIVFAGQGTASKRGWTNGCWRNTMTRTRFWFACLFLATGLAVPIAALARAPASVSAICKDGSTFTGTSRRGACHGHGGVQSWTTAAAETATTAPAAPVTATCRDGTSFTGTTRRGACRGHGGVQTWTTVTAPATTPPSAPTTTAIAPSAPAAPARGTRTVNNPMPGQVWVNTASKVYHCPGDLYYGTTKHGEYLSEAAAKAEGDRPSRGKSCS